MRRPGFVVGAAFVSHLPALGAGYVWLDHAHLEDGGAAIARPSEFLQLFTHGFAGTGYYRPLTSLSLSLDALFGSAAVFHFVNLAWHSAAALGVMLAAEALGLSRRVALWAAILFAVHPLSTLVADAIAFRSEAMLTAALMTLLWAHKRERPMLAAAALAFAALTKETGLVLAPLLILTLERKPRLLRAEGAAFALVAIMRLVWAPPWRATYASMSAADQFGTRFASVAKSAAALVGVERSICDAFAVTHPWQPTAVAGGVALGVLAYFAWKNRGVTLLLALSVLPALQLVPVTRWWSPHYLYVPLAFVAMLLAPHAERFVNERSSRRVVGLTVAAVLGAITFHDALRYENDSTLWTPEAQHQQACREAQFYLGEVDRGAQRWEAAAKRYEAALAEHPGILAFVDHAAAWQNLGTVRFEQKRYADARRAYRQALDGTTDPQRRRELTHNLAGATFADGDAAETLHLLAEECARADAFPASGQLCVMARRKLAAPPSEPKAIE